MGRYRRRGGQIIEAEQYEGLENPEAWPKGVCTCSILMGPHLHTAHEGQLVALTEGDFVVPESKAPDRYYPVKPDVFTATYEEVDETEGGPIVTYRGECSKCGSVQESTLHFKAGTTYEQGPGLSPQRFTEPCMICRAKRVTHERLS